MQHLKRRLALLACLAGVLVALVLPSAAKANIAWVGSACTWQPNSQHGYCTFTLYFWQYGAYYFYSQKSGTTVQWSNLPDGSYKLVATHENLSGTRYFSGCCGQSQFVEVFMS